MDFGLSSEFSKHKLYLRWLDLTVVGAFLGYNSEKREALMWSLVGERVRRGVTRPDDHISPVFFGVVALKRLQPPAANVVSSHYLSYRKLMSKRDPYTSSLSYMCKHHYIR